MCYANLLQSCPTLCDPVDHSLPVSPVHGILQARILEQVVMSFSRVSFRPRDQTHVSYVSCVRRGVFFTTSTTLGEDNTSMPSFHLLEKIYIIYYTCISQQFFSWCFIIITQKFLVDFSNKSLFFAHTSELTVFIIRLRLTLSGSLRYTAHMEVLKDARRQVKSCRHI